MDLLVMSAKCSVWRGIQLIEPRTMESGEGSMSMSVPMTRVFSMTMRCPPQSMR